MQDIDSSGSTIFSHPITTRSRAHHSSSIQSYISSLLLQFLSMWNHIFRMQLTQLLHVGVIVLLFFTSSLQTVDCWATLLTIVLPLICDANCWAALPTIVLPLICDANCWAALPTIVLPRICDAINTPHMSIWFYEITQKPIMSRIAFVDSVLSRSAQNQRKHARQIFAHTLSNLFPFWCRWQSSQRKLRLVFHRHHHCTSLHICLDAWNIFWRVENEEKPEVVVRFIFDTKLIIIFSTFFYFIPESGKRISMLSPCRDKSLANQDLWHPAP